MRNVALPLLLLAAISGCTHAPGPRPIPKAEPATPLSTPQPSVLSSTATTAPATQATSLSVILVLHPDGETQKVLEILRSHPDLGVTIVFPPRYFEEPGRRPLISQFSALQSSKTIEIGMALDNEPILPLLSDLTIAGEKARKWGVSYAWREDVASQVARGSGNYQKRWGTLPAGFYPPYSALSEPVVETLKRFRMNWVIGVPNETWGVRFYGGTALLVPPKPVEIDELNLGSKAWAEKTMEWIRPFPYVLIDTGLLEDPRAEQIFLDLLSKRKADFAPLVTAQRFVESLQSEFGLPRDAQPFAYDYSPWVATGQQKRAWVALAEARKVIDAYQSSGRANLQRLDAAVEEMCSAQSGAFLLDLGSAPSPNALSDGTTAERNFLATLANIYRLCGAPIPPNLNTWFANRTWQKTPQKTTPNDGPFFTETAQSIKWTDPQEDDNGSGNLIYPAGSYTKGMFDLREVKISWDETDITLSVGVTETFAGKSKPIVPLVDIYIDVNRLADAGNTAALKRRSNTAVHREAAWEYAVSFSANVGALYQAVPGGAPRALSVRSAAGSGRTFSVSFPRTLLRGNPKQWRISAGLMGTENTRRQEEPVPVAVTVTASDKSFGGASSSRVAPFVDILGESVEDQVSKFLLNAQGGPLTLPYVEVQ